jgi:tRNA-splicing ligase RtcB
MKKLKLKGKELRNIGYPESPVISLAMNVMEKNFKHTSYEDALEILKSVLANPTEFAEDELLKPIAKFLLEDEAKNKLKEKYATLSDKELKEYLNNLDGEIFELKPKGISFSTYGAEHIEAGALNQMYIAAKLPFQ